MRVLILGADNTVGSRVLAALRTTDWAEPVAASNAVDNASLPEALAASVAVVNCTMGDAGRIVSAAQTLFAAASGSVNLPHIVHLSSMTVYGKASGLIQESAPLSGELGAYAAAQVAAEQLAADCPRAVRLRPGCEYGPGCWDWSGRVARWLIARRLGDLGEQGMGCCNLLYIDDLIAAIIAALTLPGVEGRAFNLAGSQLSWNQYFAAFAEALNARPLRQMSRSRLAYETRLLAPPLKIAEIVARKAGFDPHTLPPAIPPSLPALCQQDIRLNVAEAEATLGLRWTPLAQGLREAAVVYGKGT